VHRLALAGTPEVCRQQLIDLLAEVPQISNVVIVPFPSEDRTVEEVVGSFIDEVAVGRPG
jgi:alkanesulfonate monooxygenase SsuD/methylene tetrahydromethanopterin reductase-like flavin-dependent oxidoreductase (luciferase family)